MSSSTFGKNIMFLLMANVLIKPLYIFGIEAQAQNMLGTSTWGMYFSLFNFCFLFQIILDPGIHNYNTVTIAGDRSRLSANVGQTITMKLLLGLAFLVLLAVGGFIMSYETMYYKLLMLIGLNFFLSSLFVFFKSHFPAMGKYSRESFYSVLDKVLLLVILGTQIYILKDLSLLSFIVSITIANVLAIIIVLVGLGKMVPLKMRFSFKEAKKILKQSMGFALVAIFMNLYNRMDGVMLERMLNDDGYAAGVYAAGYRLLDASNMFALLFASILLPMFANTLKNKEGIKELLANSGKLMLAAVSIIVLIGYFYSTQIMDLIYVDYNDLYGQSFKILIVSFLGVGMSYIFGTLITASGKLFYFNMLLFLGIAINWTLNYLWIPEDMAIGAAKATLITQIFVMLGQWILVIKMFGWHYKFKDQAKTLLYLILAVMTAYYLSKAGLPWVLGAGLTVIILIIASFLLGLIRLDTFLSKETSKATNKNS